MKLNKPKTTTPKHRKAPETVRERATKQLQPRELKTSKLRGKIHRSLSVLRRVAIKEFHPIKIQPKSRMGRFLSRRFNLIPTFLVNAFKEVKQVSWPSRKTALKLTLAVIIFATVFAIFVQIFGILFEKLFKYILTS